MHHSTWCYLVSQFAVCCVVAVHTANAHANGSVYLFTQFVQTQKTFQHWVVLYLVVVAFYIVPSYLCIFFFYFVYSSKINMTKSRRWTVYSGVAGLPRRNRPQTSWKTSKLAESATMDRWAGLQRNARLCLKCQTTHTSLHRRLCVSVPMVARIVLYLYLKNKVYSMVSVCTICKSVLWNCIFVVVVHLVPLGGMRAHFIALSLQFFFSFVFVAFFCPAICLLLLLATTDNHDAKMKMFCFFAMLQHCNAIAETILYYVFIWG